MVVVCFRTLLYKFSQKVWAENGVLIESSRGLDFLTITHYHNYAKIVQNIRKLFEV